MMIKSNKLATTIISLGFALLILYFGNTYADLVFPSTAEKELTHFFIPFLREGIALIIIGFCLKSTLKSDLKNIDLRRKE